MINRRDVIKGLEICINRIPGEYSCAKCHYETYGNDCEIRLTKDALAILKEQEEIKEQFIEAFNTIRDAYNTPANREKILLNYLLRNTCCCADLERKESR